MFRYRATRTDPSGSKDMVPTSIAGAQHPGNDFPDAGLASLTLLGGTSARAQVAAGDTAFVMAIHGATLVSTPPVLADVDPTSIGYADGDPSSRPALAAASDVRGASPSTARSRDTAGGQASRGGLRAAPPVRCAGAGGGAVPVAVGRRAPNPLTNVTTKLPMCTKLST